MKDISSLRKEVAKLYSFSIKENKFRGQNNGDWWQKGEWVYGDLMHSASGTYIYKESEEGFAKTLVDEKTIGQYIGLADSNRKQIYDGDILYVKKEDLFVEVVWNMSSANYDVVTKDGVILEGFFYDHDSCSIKVVGNIFDGRPQSSSFGKNRQPRKIVFRGQSDGTWWNNKGEWVYGDLIHRDSATFIYTENADGFIKVPVISGTVGQDTGFLDSEGTHIYEGDIVYTEKNNLSQEVFWLSFINSYVTIAYLSNAGVTDESFFFKHNSSEIRVTGNVFLNPETLTGICRE